MYKMYNVGQLNTLYGRQSASLAPLHYLKRLKPSMLKIDYDNLETVSLLILKLKILVKQGVSCVLSSCKIILTFSLLCHEGVAGITTNWVKSKMEK